MNGNSYNASNWILFGAAALWALGLASWFTLAFFRNHLNVHDVSVDIMLVGIGFIGAYAGHNKFFKKLCGNNGKPKPGEWFFAALVVWSVVMLTIYQTKALFYWKGIELVMPEHFIVFLGSILAIFTGTRIWDIFSSSRPTDKTQAK